MKKRNFNFSTKINKLKRRLKYFAEIVSKKEKQMREANARKLNCSIDDINKFYTETKDPSKQAMVFKGEIITPEERKELYNINTWMGKIKTDGQEKASQKFIDFVQREQPLLKEYEEVFNNGETPDKKGRLLEVITTPDNYNWEVWKVDSYEASRYLGGSFGDSVVKKNIGDNYTKHYEDKQISYRQHEARWCISYCKDDYWKNYYEDEGSKFIFLIRQDFNEDRFGKIAIQIKKNDELIFWDSEDEKRGFEYDYEHFGFLIGELKEKNYLKSRPFLNEEEVEIINGVRTFVGDIEIKTKQQLEGFARCKIHTVTGNFECNFCHNLINLVGAPKKVGGDFDCRYNPNLTSLEGAPLEVGGNFNCSDCTSLKTFKGAPKKVGGYLNCSDCGSLTSLIGAPQIVNGDFDCSGCKKIESLEGAPEFVGGDFVCSWCENITSLDGASKTKVKGGFLCHNCPNLTSLKGAPLEVGGDFVCNFNPNLKSLEGAPEFIGGYFSCRRCENLTSLVGAPKEVGGDFDCSWCRNLKSLEGRLKKVGGNFDCSGCPNLTSLDGAPKEVIGDFRCRGGNLTITDEDRKKYKINR